MSTAEQTSTAAPPLSARQAYRDLIRLNFQFFGIAFAVVAVFVWIGMELTPLQAQLAPLLGVPITLLVVIPETLIVRYQYRPIRRALAELDAGRTPPAEDLSRAIVRSLNLPLLSFLRVSLFEGPAAAVAIVSGLLWANWMYDVGYTTFQLLYPTMIVLAFGSPTHAVFDFFATSRFVVRIVEQLSARGDILPEDRTELKATSIRSKLLYVAIFITSVPLLFFVAGLVYQVQLMFGRLGVEPSFEQLQGLAVWIGTTVIVCIGGALTMSVLLANEVSRSAATLMGAMGEVENGRLDVKLPATSTDEYAGLFRGFNMMVDGLREEVKILETSQALMAEIHLDRLLEQIIVATTDLLDAERGTLFIHDRKTNELFSRFAEGLVACEYPRAPEGAIREIRVAADEGVAGAVFTTGKGQNISDPYANPLFNPEIDRQTGFRTRSILAMPICNKHGQRIGVTQVLNKRGGQFTTKDESRLKAFTAQIAIALENARLFDDVLSMKNYNESILRSTSNGMLTLDKGNVATANDATLAILGAEREAIVERPAAQVFAGNEWVLAAIDKVEKTGETAITMDADMKLARGGSASVNLTAVPLIDLNRESIGSMLILEDITVEKRVKSTMSRYMSKEVADQLIESGESILVGKDQQVSILFSDIRNFTSFSEELGARETVAMLNEYFAEMVDVIFRCGGILDKYIGDAIMALFGAPFSRPTDADNAVEAANQMIVILRELNRRRAAAGRSPIEIGVGISTGNVIVGSIGSPKRMEYTAIGDSVNLASRLEGATKIYGAKVLVSEFTVRGMKKPALLREIDVMRVKGKQQSVAVYEALDHHDAETFPHREEVLDAYRSAMEHFKKQDWPAAARLFEVALAAHPADKPSRIYLERCSHFIANPPAPDWNPVSVLTEK